MFLSKTKGRFMAIESTPLEASFRVSMSYKSALMVSIFLVISFLYFSGKIGKVNVAYTFTLTIFLEKKKNFSHNSSLLITISADEGW